MGKELNPKSRITNRFPTRKVKIQNGLILEIGMGDLVFGFWNLQNNRKENPL